MKSMLIEHKLVGVAIWGIQSKEHVYVTQNFGIESVEVWTVHRQTKIDWASRKQKTTTYTIHMFYVETLEQGKTNEDQISLYIDKSTKE